MTRRYARLIAAAIFIAAFSASISAQQETVAEVRAKAEQGVVEAQYNLGVMYGTGRGVPEDDAEAVRWYRLAADQGNHLAQVILGGMYGNGQGVPQDYVQAHMWFNITTSRATGVQRERAVENRDRVEGDLTPDAINEARRFAREWDAAHRR